MSVPFAELIRGLPIALLQGDGSAVIRGLATDSRRVAPGFLFVALPGQRTDGSRFIEEAAQRGAVAVVAEDEAWAPPSLTIGVCPEVRAVLPELASRFHRQPQRDLALFGLAGTAGKSVVAHLLHQFLDPRETGVLGTISYQLGARSLPAARTTPEAVELYAMLDQMRLAGCSQAVLEVSSHGLHQGRVAGLPFSLAAFLNLTPEHMSYHGTMEDYFETVASLFDGRNGPPPPLVVLNVDDPHSELLRLRLPSTSRLVTFGTSDHADLRAAHPEYSLAGTSYTLSHGDQAYLVRTPMLGDFAVMNTLAALAIAQALERDLPAAIGALADLPGPPGRMEAVGPAADFTVLVDYAHTEAAYDKALHMLRRLAPRRLITVFGCGGGRDRDRRPRITRLVHELSDVAIATADNLRGEALDTIFADMRAGLPAGHHLQFIDDRRRAISEALDAATTGDVVLIAGKGHEAYQEFAHTVIPFNDRAVACDLLRTKGRLRA